MEDNENEDRGLGSMSGSTKDELVKDLLDIAHKYLIFTEQERLVNFIQAMCIYIVERDGRILKHGYDVAMGNHDRH